MVDSESGYYVHIVRNELHSCYYKLLVENKNLVILTKNPEIKGDIHFGLNPSQGNYYEYISCF